MAKYPVIQWFNMGYKVGIKTNLTHFFLDLKRSLYDLPY